MIKNFYTANSIEPGDVFVCTIKIMVQYDGSFVAYRCPWPNAEVSASGEPQGDYIGNETMKIEQIMPIIQNWKAMKAFANERKE